jgi:hypothetical protein
MGQVLRLILEVDEFSSFMRDRYILELFSGFIGTPLSGLKSSKEGFEI